jgi:hypothetical protein
MGGSLGMPLNYGETPGSASPGPERIQFDKMNEVWCFDSTYWGSKPFIT